ncbi:MAG TPA: hypothetical protein VEJ67_17510 [Candidatus Cybelea sp.]|nr:hypothetical protein [Candidatus Cybelea sp.]
MIRRWKVFGAALLLLGTWAWHAARGHEQSRAKSGATEEAKSSVTVPGYDVTKEVKIRGTIRKIDAFGTNESAGTHIFIKTAGGDVDVQLGFGAESNPTYLRIAPGQNVTAIGMMQGKGTTRELVARILTTPNHIFVLRNERGIPVRATPRRNSSADTLFGCLGGNLVGRSARETLRG